MPMISKDEIDWPYLSILMYIQTKETLKLFISASSFQETTDEG